MGILNVTPDSFTDGGIFFNNPRKAIRHAQKMRLQGADIIDIGGQSIRVGAVQVPVKEELRRVIPVIKGIRADLGEDVVISVDTYKAEVAEAAVSAGADIINDVTGLQMDKRLPEIVASTGAGIVVTHMRNRLGIKDVPGDVIKMTNNFFETQIQKLASFGVSRNQIILDPGFGFAKTPDVNLEIVKRLGEFKNFKLPVMLALSRKGAFGKILQKEFDSIMDYGINERLAACLAATASGVLSGASVIRTHDVYQTKNFLAILDKLKG